LAVGLELLKTTTSRYALFVNFSREFLDKLKKGDPEALNDYRAELARRED